MKVKYLVISILAAAFLSSAIDIDRNVGAGKKAPKIETIDGTNVVKDANSENKMKVVSFWSPKKPASRIANRNLSLKYGTENEEVEFISICTDPDESLMKEVMKQDGISETRVFVSREISPRVLKDYDAEKNPRVFVIGPDGLLQ
ncbi:MAG: hypothetical protein J1F43_04925 [Muribaculaceae bacterium]|nr:hypothetical protein [Muribaculaceae bacterium]